MNESRDLVPVAPLLITVVAVAGLTSAVWWIFWQQHDSERAGHVARISERLELVEADRSRLVDRYTAAEQARHEQELEVLSLQNELKTTRQQLAALEAGNWPERYSALEEENYNLSERIEELELRSNIARDNYTAEYEQLQQNHDDLEKKFISLEHEYDDLERRYRQARESADEKLAKLELAVDEAELERRQQDRWRHALERDLINREIGDSRLEARISTLEQERRQLQAALNESEQRVRTLNQRTEQLSGELQAAREHAGQPTPPPVRKLESQAPPPAVTAATGDSGADPGFRLARLESLESALQDASSSDRKAIILTVLPTIPGGVQGPELADLLAGMDSQDIIDVIRGSQPHIKRPVDNDSYKRIMQQLEDGDSRQLVTRLLQ